MKDTYEARYNFLSWNKDRSIAAASTRAVAKIQRDKAEQPPFSPCVMAAVAFAQASYPPPQHTKTPLTVENLRQVILLAGVHKNLSLDAWGKQKQPTEQKPLGTDVLCEPLELQTAVGGNREEEKSTRAFLYLLPVT